ncbi:CBS domain-containing protein [Maridesulfovibrio hydrothermalis]|uniref:CBS domain containing protein n=1 Tax=Maridesulfovibrio hydrothermalis AM13 = DSM 14728 TaxID=1121451 RepID=L0RAC1_9BACT|nr:CBS domain-containing protein [Maridesulfovibrio hydrothermalis]CCO23728.1 CBS domain containing protein [Maridesulfovibrio hydrothermalis AM13 = DSM 14728]
MDSLIVRVRDVMQPDVLSIDGMTSAKEAAEMMRTSKVSELLVSKRNEDDAWGIITVNDLVKDVVVPNRDANSVYVYEIMTKPIIAVPAQMDIRYAVRLIHRIGIHRAPVEHMGEIIGMVTLSSLILDNDLL